MMNTQQSKFKKDNILINSDLCKFTPEMISMTCNSTKSQNSNQEDFYIKYHPSAPSLFPPYNPVKPLTAANIQQYGSPFSLSRRTTNTISPSPIPCQSQRDSGTMTFEKEQALRERAKNFSYNCSSSRLEINDQQGMIKLLYIREQVEQEEQLNLNRKLKKLREQSEIDLEILEQCNQYLKQRMLIIQTLNEKMLQEQGKIKQTIQERIQSSILKQKTPSNSQNRSKKSGTSVAQSPKTSRDEQPLKSALKQKLRKREGEEEEIEDFSDDWNLIMEAKTNLQRGQSTSFKKSPGKVRFMSQKSEFTESILKGLKKKHKKKMQNNENNITNFLNNQAI